MAASFPAGLLPKDEARRIYEEIVRTKRDPALLEYMGRGLYRTSVFPIPPGADRKVTMRYTQLCKRDRDVVEFSYPLSTQKFTAKPIQRLIVQVSIQGKDAIKSVYCPSDDVRIDRTGDHEVKVNLERRDLVPDQRFSAGLYTRRGQAVGVGPELSAQRGRRMAISWCSPARRSRPPAPSPSPRR